MTALTTQRSTRRHFRGLGVAGAALLLAAAAASGVVWRVHSAASHPTVPGAAITQPAPARPVLVADREASTAAPHTAVSAPLAPQLWLVRTPAQAAQLQQQLADDETTRAQAGGRALDAQVLAVTTAAQAEGVQHALDTVNLTRAIAGLAPIELVDLR